MTCRILYLNSDFSSSEEWNSSTLSLVIFLWPLTLCHRSWAWSWGLSECHWRRAGKTSWTANAPVFQPGPWELTQQWRWGHTGPVLQRREAEVKVHDTTHTTKAQWSIKAPHTCVTGWLASPQQAKNVTSLIHPLQFLTFDRNLFKSCNLLALVWYHPALTDRQI